MSIIDVIIGLFSSDSSNDFAGQDPDDMDIYWRMDHDIDQAEREGEQALAAALQKYNLKSMDHWETVSGNYCQRHQGNPEFMCASTKVNTEAFMGQVAETYQVPAQCSEPVEGITLHDLAVITARSEAQPAAMDATLAEYGLDQAAFQRVQTTWQQRLSGVGVDPFAANVLTSQWQAHISMARGIHARG